jgi:hypothetical protein
MKIKCIKIDCEKCHVIGSCQVFFNREGKITYARVRHYLKLVDGKPRFEYHKQSTGYINEKLKETNGLSGKDFQFITNTNDDLGHKNDDHKNLKNASFYEMEPRAGFGPATITLPR